MISCAAGWRGASDRAPEDLGARIVGEHGFELGDRCGYRFERQDPDAGGLDVRDQAELTLCWLQHRSEY